MNINHVNVMPANVIASGPNADGSATVSVNVLFAKDAQAKTLAAALVTAVNAQTGETATPAMINVQAPATGNPIINANWPGGVALAPTVMTTGSVAQTAYAALVAHLAAKGV